MMFKVENDEKIYTKIITKKKIISVKLHIDETQ